MRNIVVILFTILSFSYNTVTGQSKKTTNFPGTPFQGTKEFCSFHKPLKFKVAIKGFDVLITEQYDNEKPRTVKGVYKKGKVYTNSPLEKKYKMGG